MTSDNFRHVVVNCFQFCNFESIKTADHRFFRYRLQL